MNLTVPWSRAKTPPPPEPVVIEPIVVAPPPVEKPPPPVVVAPAPKRDEPLGVMREDDGPFWKVRVTGSEERPEKFVEAAEAKKKQKLVTV